MRTEDAAKEGLIRCLASLAIDKVRRGPIEFESFYAGKINHARLLSPRANPIPLTNRFFVKVTKIGALLTNVTVETIQTRPSVDRRFEAAASCGNFNHRLSRFPLLRNQCGLLLHEQRFLNDLASFLSRIPVLRPDTFRIIPHRASVARRPLSDGGISMVGAYYPRERKMSFRTSSNRGRAVNFVALNIRRELPTIAVLRRRSRGEVSLAPYHRRTSDVS
jgi:hypothetical protein